MAERNTLKAQPSVLCASKLQIVQVFYVNIVQDAVRHFCYFDKGSPQGFVILVPVILGIVNGKEVKCQVVKTMGSERRVCVEVLP